MQQPHTDTIGRLFSAGDLAYAETMAWMAGDPRLAHFEAVLEERSEASYLREQIDALNEQIHQLGTCAALLRQNLRSILRSGADIDPDDRLLAQQAIDDADQVDLPD